MTPHYLSTRCGVRTFLPRRIQSYVSAQLESTVLITIGANDSAESSAFSLQFVTPNDFWSFIRVYGESKMSVMQRKHDDDEELQLMLKCFPCIRRVSAPWAGVHVPQDIQAPQSLAAASEDVKVVLDNFPAIENDRAGDVHVYSVVDEFEESEDTPAAVGHVAPIADGSPAIEDNRAGILSA